jgi:hypothetical protein
MQYNAMQDISKVVLPILFLLSDENRSGYFEVTCSKSQGILANLQFEQSSIGSELSLPCKINDF